MKLKTVHLARKYSELADVLQNLDDRGYVPYSTNFGLGLFLYQKVVPNVPESLTCRDNDHLAINLTFFEVPHSMSYLMTASIRQSAADGNWYDLNAYNLNPQIITADPRSEFDGVVKRLMAAMVAVNEH